MIDTLYYTKWKCKIIKEEIKKKLNILKEQEPWTENRFKKNNSRSKEYWNCNLQLGIQLNIKLRYRETRKD